MQKVLSVVLVLVTIISMLSFCSYAMSLSEENTVNFNDGGIVEYYDDGTYSITVIELSDVAVADTQTTSGTKTKTVYDGTGDALFACKVTGTFNYSGSNAICTASSTSYVIYDDYWKVTSHIASKTVNKAVGDFVAKKYVLGIAFGTTEYTVTLSCTPNGTLQ